MSETRNLFADASEAASAVVRGAGGADLDGPTPCEDFDVAALIDHWAGTTAAMAKVGRGDALDPANPWGSDRRASAGDWQGELATNLAAMAEGWSQASPWTGKVEVGGQEMSGGAIGQMAFIEAIVHAWDLAKGTGQELAVSDEVAAELRRLMDETGTMGRDMGAYGPEVAVDPTDDLAAALGASGRNPRWSPPT